MVKVANFEFGNRASKNPVDFGNAKTGLWADDCNTILTFGYWSVKDFETSEVSARTSSVGFMLVGSGLSLSTHVRRRALRDAR